MTNIFSSHLFWDVQIPSIHKHRNFIISRVLDEGNDEDVVNLWKLYSEDEIKGVIKNRKNLSPRAAYFWTAFFGLNDDQCVSIQE